MANVIQIRNLPNPAALYARIASTLLKKGKGSLPDIKIQYDNQIIQPSDLKKYNKVCGFEHTLIVPSTFIHTRAFELQALLLTHPACPFPYPGLIVFANTIKQTRSLYVGEEFNLSCSFGNLIAHEKGQGFNLDLRILRDDEVVWSATQSLLRVGVAQKSGKPYASPITDEAALSRQADFNAASDLGRRYGAVSGDRNPIHLTAMSAKLFGFRRAIAHGMWTKARALSCLLPAQQLEQASVAVDFKTPLFLPSRASLWSARKPDGALFEVRDAKGQRPHLRGQLQY